MKNFSEVTATRSRLKIALWLRPVGEPWAVIKSCDDLIFNGIIKDDICLDVDHDLMTPLSLSIELKDKTYSLDHETAIIVNKITVDDISIIPEMSHHFHYENDHGFTDPTCYLGFNGIWRLDTQQCFYRWWHRATGQGWLLSPTA